VIFGALLWCTDKLKSEQGETARKLWGTKGKQAFDMHSATLVRTDP
jgi:Conjugal transfer protein TraD